MHSPYGCIGKKCPRLAKNCNGGAQEKVPMAQTRLKFLRKFPNLYFKIYYLKYNKHFKYQLYLLAGAWHKVGTVRKIFFM